MPTITGTRVGESQVGEGFEVAHVDILLGPRGSPVEAAFAQCLTHPTRGHGAVLATLLPNLMVKPATVLFNKVSLRHTRQSAQLYGPAQRGVARAIADSMGDGVLPTSQAQDLFICIGVFIHWDATDEQKIEDYNYRATREALARAVSSLPTPGEVLEKKDLF